MLRWGLVAICVAALGGCVSGSLTSTQAACSSADPSYLGAWSCIRERVAANKAGDMTNPEGQRYLAFGDAMAERVRARQISDADARLALAAELQGANASYEARRDAAIAAANAGGPVYMPDTRSKFAPSVSCTSRVVGGVVRTDC